MGKWKRRLGNRRGQSILEYLVIATAVVAAIIAIKATVSSNMNTLYTNAADKTGEAGTGLGALKVEEAK